MVELRTLKKGSHFLLYINGRVLVKGDLWFRCGSNITYLVEDLKHNVLGKLNCHEMVISLC